MPLTQQYVSLTYRPPEVEAAVVSGHSICSVLRDEVELEIPWLPLVANNGIDRPGTGQNDGPKMALTLAACCWRSP